jgi:hypothetical protein
MDAHGTLDLVRGFDGDLAGKATAATAAQGNEANEIWRFDAVMGQFPNRALEIRIRIRTVTLCRVNSEDVDLLWCPA